MRIAILSLLFLALAPASSSRVPIDIENGNGLLRSCTSEGAEQSYCLGFIFGVMEGVYYKAIADSTRLPWCHPNGVQMEQIRDVIMKYLRDRPERRQMRSAGLIMSALQQAWPCANSVGQ
jgi:hypothetical protein